ncbi:tetratricopeptide repeat-containing sulfotransferase family protein [Paraburkholderia acidipaludis]|uniref:tetratricopeptide repeat-containing sulfotransferase family protein n=1 Tax=Paraburkholderia acidipaludis TaxID=660537 RepID=UPI00069433E8|nr:tetratricopeptide repeat-containing sulfotransferase family protein [Paraburkholderia acidipaludis]
MSRAPLDLTETFQRAQALLRQGQRAEAEACLQQILQTDPAHADALHTSALLRRAGGDAAGAAQLLERAIASRPERAIFHADLGLALQAMRRPQDALAAFSRALALAPASADILIAQANLLRDLGRPAEALDGYAAALRLQSQRADAWAGHGDALHLLGRRDEALASYDRALALQPGLAAAWYNRATLLRGLDRHDEALASLNRTLELAPDFVEALNNRGNLLRHFNRHAEALADYDRALALRPAYAAAHSNRGNVLRELNRLDDARSAYQRAIDAAPGEVMHYRNLASVTRLTRDDPCFMALARFALHEAELGAQDRVYLHFALGDALMEFGERDEAFDHYLSGNALQRARVQYDEARTLAAFGQMRRTFTPARLDAVRGGGDACDSPVFIVGMPRSGSTLIEQVLSSHPHVYGAGECGFFADALHAQEEQRSRTTPGRGGSSGEWDANDFGALGADYLRRIRLLGGIDAGYRRVVDKSLPNFMNLGLIHLALPNARIIHARREAVDCCLSAFSRLLTMMPFSFELGELGRYYAAYERLMDHWRAVLPPGVMLEVRYEDMVSDLPREARRMLDHCGLEWDPACLDFHRSDRAVATASSLQVRQPIYASSVRRWRPAPAHLAPLIEGLGESSADGAP